MSGAVRGHGTNAPRRRRGGWRRCSGRKEVRPPIFQPQSSSTSTCYTGPSTSTSSPGAGSASDEDGSDDDENSDDDVEILPEPETDTDRRRTLLESMSASDAAGLRSGTQRFMDEFLMPVSSSTARAGASRSRAAGDGPRSESVDGVSDDAMPPGCDVLELPTKGSTAASNASASTSAVSAPTAHTPPTAQHPPAKRQKTAAGSSQTTLPYGGLVRDEVSYRKMEALGMEGGAGSMRTLGAVVGPTDTDSKAGIPGDKRRSAGRSRLLGLVPASENEKNPNAETKTTTPGSRDHKEENEAGDKDTEWTCLVCTLSVIHSYHPHPPSFLNLRRLTDSFHFRRVT